MPIFRDIRDVRRCDPIASRSGRVQHRRSSSGDFSKKHLCENRRFSFFRAGFVIRAEAARRFSFPLRFPNNVSQRKRRQYFERLQNEEKDRRYNSAFVPRQDQVHGLGQCADCGKHKKCDTPSRHGLDRTAVFVIAQTCAAFAQAE